MRAMVRSQPATNFSGGGLPVCLSGIGIHPRVQASNRYPRFQHYHRHETSRTRRYDRQNSIGDNFDIKLLETALSRSLQDISISEGSAREDYFQEWSPRHAVALQMADLDRRREAMRKNRTNRGSSNEERRATLVGGSGRHSQMNSVRHSQINTLIHAVMQDPSFQLEFDKQLYRHKCAKAA